jgi:SAM-dependent methyltransferase
MSRTRPGVDLFLASVLVLFLELACIRWFPAHVIFLSFFTNTMLLASFIGMSVGCILARRQFHHIKLTPILLFVALGCGLMVDRYSGLFSEITNVGNQEKPDVVFFGAESGVVGDLKFHVPVEVMAGAFFLLAGAALVGPGQELGRAFNRMANRTTSYTCNLLGSLVGIAGFAACSQLQLPPVVWFSVVAVLISYFLLRPEPDGPAAYTRLLPLALAVLATVPTSFSGVPGFTAHQEVYWSPYYRVDYQPQSRDITTNKTSHQLIQERKYPTQAPYDLPYLFGQELGRPAYKRVLVIGAGSGNDLVRALYWCPPDAKIDAVEIDPVIQKLGAKYNPEQPYADPRITLHLNDGRNFLRKAESGTYDLVVFALVDSLVLHSGYSNIRLESFLFSTESFADVKRVLKPDGLAAVYNMYRQGWIMARLRDALRTTFDAEPVVLIDPPYKKGPEIPIEEGFLYNGLALFFIGPKASIDPLREKFIGQSFWVPGRAGMSKELPGRFSTSPPNENYGSGLPEAAERPAWVPLDQTKLQESPKNLIPATDDWPFLYVRQPGIPGLTWRGIGLTLLLSGVLWAIFGGWMREDPLTPNPSPTRGEGSLYARAFLLGAGFMLIETKAVVQMALLFGSTWTVNTFVFSAILVMAVIGNLFAGAVKPKRLELYYVGLFATIGVGLAVPLDVFLGMNPVTQVVAACALAFCPILFAGVIFPTTFARTTRPDLFFAANVAGALVGGLAENASMLLGFRYLLLVALGFYALSAVFGGRKQD